MNIPLPVIVHFSQGPVHGEVWDIGAGGAFILCERKPATGEKVAIIFASREGDDFVTIEGTVVRSTNEGIGVRFGELSDTEQRFLNQVVTDSFRVEFGDRFVRRKKGRK